MRDSKHTHGHVENQRIGWINEKITVKISSTVKFVSEDGEQFIISNDLNTPSLNDEIYMHHRSQ